MVSTTFLVVLYSPPVGLALAVGGMVSIVYSSVYVVEGFPARSCAKNFRVVVELMVIGPVYVLLLVVGVVPLVV